MQIMAHFPCENQMIRLKDDVVCDRVSGRENLNASIRKIDPFSSNSTTSKSLTENTQATDAEVYRHLSQHQYK